MPNLDFFSKRPFLQLVLLTAIALIIHAIVLKFIFPGYYSPLYPHHSDFYISQALAHAPGDFFQYKSLGYSRPLGFFFLKMIGFLGIHGAILFTVINVAVNVGATALFVRRFMNIPFGVKFILMFCIYCYLLFSQSFFYTFYTHDVFSHLSYFFLLIGVYFFYKFFDRNNWVGGGLLALFSIMAFLCKETYMLSALFLSFVWFIYSRKKSFRKAILPLIIFTGMVVMVSVFNYVIKSVFVNFQNNVLVDTYYVNFTPRSVISELARYADEGLNLILWTVIGLMIIAAISYAREKDKRILYMIFGCIIAAIMTLLPNAVIPNHHNGGYSFSAAYLLYLPVIFIPLLQNNRVMIPYIGVLVIGLSVISPFFNRTRYASQWWVLLQEETQRNILGSLDTLMREIKPAQTRHNILVTGLTMAFYPFHHPLALLDYKNSRFANFDVVNYSLLKSTERSYSVKFILPTEIKIGQYDEIWMFAGDGSLIRKLRVNTGTADIIEKKETRDLIIYPDSLKNSQLSLLIK
jgi:hypothetical protein